MRSASFLLVALCAPRIDVKSHPLSRGSAARCRIGYESKGHYDVRLNKEEHLERIPTVNQNEPFQKEEVISFLVSWCAHA